MACARCQVRPIVLTADSALRIRVSAPTLETAPDPEFELISAQGRCSMPGFEARPRICQQCGSVYFPRARAVVTTS